MASLTESLCVVAVAVQAQRRELKCSRRAPGYFTLIGDKAPPAASDSSEVAHVVILTLETAGTVGVWAVAYPCR